MCYWIKQNQNQFYQYLPLIFTHAWVVPDVCLIIIVHLKAAILEKKHNNFFFFVNTALK